MPSALISPVVELSQRILSGVAQGMAYLHSLKIVHRDLTSANILVLITHSEGEGFLFSSLVVG